MQAELVTANVVPSSPILVTLTTEAALFFETSVLTRTARPRRNIPENHILHSHRRENLKSYMAGLCSRNVSLVKYGLDFYIPEDDILLSHRRDYFKSYIILIVVETCRV
jgi:hypothetical protein